MCCGILMACEWHVEPLMVYPVSKNSASICIEWDTKIMEPAFRMHNLLATRHSHPVESTDCCRKDSARHELSREGWR